MIIKVKVFNKNKEVERESVIEEFEKISSLYDVEESLEDAVDAGLDILCEKNPAFFASEVDGKIYGYDFEVIDPSYDPNYVD